MVPRPGSPPVSELTGRVPVTPFSVFWTTVAPEPGSFEPRLGTMALESGVLFPPEEAADRAGTWPGDWLAEEFRTGSVLLIAPRPGISPVTALRPGSALVIEVRPAGVVFCAVLSDTVLSDTVLSDTVAFFGVPELDPLHDWPVRPVIAELTSPDSGLPAMSQMFADTWDPVTAWVTVVSGEPATVWARAGAAPPASTKVAEATPPRKTCHLYTKRSRSRYGSEEVAAAGKSRDRAWHRRAGVASGLRPRDGELSPDPSTPSVITV